MQDIKLLTILYMLLFSLFGVSICSVWPAVGLVLSALFRMSAAVGGWSVVTVSFCPICLLSLVCRWSVVGLSLVCFEFLGAWLGVSVCCVYLCVFLLLLVYEAIWKYKQGSSIFTLPLFRYAD